MLAKLFRRLTGDRPDDADRLFATLTAVARQPHWYVEGGVPDTIDGRFAVLATVTALAMIRLENEGEAGDRLSAALTGRFAEVMDSEHRELGVGEPTLGKTVLKLVGALARRVELWRSVSAESTPCPETVKKSLALDGASDQAIAHSADELALLRGALDDLNIEALAEGRIA